MIKKFKALPKLGKFAVTTVIVAAWGSIGAASSHQPPQVQLQTSASSKSVLSAETDSAQSSAPIITTKIATETQVIPFTTMTVNTTSLPAGTTKVTTPGVNGITTLTYKLTFTNGVQTAKDLVGQITTTQPVNQVTSIGTYVTPKPIAPASSSCDPNYSGACVPNVYPSDVDCSGGSGNGPYYVAGPVRVIGTDRYDLDRDGDGYACE